ncbi:hypothetical protein [Umezawaea sp.]|uniref:hypothetical protein n=1 Tax=Umezawaea sp. TaxID=1955258 RepID=UPI002ED25DD8
MRTPRTTTGILDHRDPTSTTPNSCSNPHVNSGTVATDPPLRSLCQLSTPPHRWFLVFVATRQQRADFAHESALSIKPGAPGRNSPF